MDVDIGVIYTHERQFMTPLVTSLAASGTDVSMRLILVENSSLDGVADWLHVFPETHLVRNKMRLGYAANLNRILAACTARYALLLNTDMYFRSSEQCVARMVHFMDDHPDCGVSGCRLYHADGSYAYPARRFQSLATIAARRLGLAGLLRGEIAGYLYENHPPDEELECDWLSGCLLMVRREAVAEIGPFDCRFQKYFEDVDFCLRMARGGWRVLLNGATSACHLEQRASRHLWSRDALIHLESYLKFVGKWGLNPRRQARPRLTTRRAA